MKSISAALYFLTAALLAADKPLPQAEAILDHFVDVTGGKAAWDTVKTQESTASLEVVGKGLKGTIQTYSLRPDKVYVVLDLEGVGKIESGSDGNVVWERSAILGARIREGEERAAALRESSLVTDWRVFYRKAETTGMDESAGQPCYKVSMTPKEGKPETLCFDVKTGYLVRKAGITKTPMGEIPTETLLSNYKEVESIRIPFTISQKVAGAEMLAQIQTVKLNGPIPADRFALPEDIKALQAKQ